MDGAEVAVLAQAGERLLALKLFLTSSHFLWAYDYLLTLGDEIQYAWYGKKSWMFVLFIANRYTPVLYLVWVNITFFDYGNCQATKWISVFHTVAVTVLAQIVVTLRIYAVSRRKKLPGSSLLVLISAQFCFGLYFLTKTAMDPAQSLPEINLDAFKICFYKRWHLGELLFTNLVMVFDLLAFSIIFTISRRPGTRRHPGVSKILDTIVQDATVYFIFMFVCQLLLEFFLIFAPEEIQPMPGVVNTVFVPIMMSRLMLSLKKAAIEPSVPWSLLTMSNIGRGATPELMTIRFAPRTLNGSQGTSEHSIPPNEGAIELESIPQDHR